MERLKTQSKTLLGFLLFLSGAGLSWAFYSPLPTAPVNIAPESPFGSMDGVPGVADFSVAIAEAADSAPADESVVASAVPPAPAPAAVATVAQPEQAGTPAVTSAGGGGGLPATATLSQTVTQATNSDKLFKKADKRLKRLQRSLNRRNR